MLTRLELLSHWEGVFSLHHLDSPRLSAQLLLAHALGLPRMEMLLDVRATVEEPVRLSFESLAVRRAKGEPVAYLLESKEFYGCPFWVTPDVLIPRPESELIIDYLARTALPGQRLVLDVGTGSGALAITCASILPQTRVVGTDISLPALQVASKNAVRNQVQDRTFFCQADLASAVRLAAFDVIMANLPYIPERTRPGISYEVLDYEPEGALFAGLDGLDAYRQLARDLRGLIRPGTVLLCEMHHEQAQAMQGLYAGWSRQVEVLRDYAGLDRVLVVVF